MAISPNALIENISNLNKCIIQWEILKITPSSFNWCTTSLDMIVKSKSWFYNIKTITTTQKDSQECLIAYWYNWDNYKNDIWKEKTILVEKNNYWLISTDENIIKQFLNTEKCSPNLEINSINLLQINLRI